MEFIESPIFTKLLPDYMDDSEYAAFQWHLATSPDAGDIIPRSGGLRKVRWSGKGKGKRGGLRIIYYYYRSDGQIWLLTVYAKNEAEDIPPKILKLLREELKNE